MENFKEVSVQQDDSGHWYVIPVELQPKFNLMLSMVDEDNSEACDMFDYEFGEYRTGGCLSLVKLYIKN